MVYGYYVTPYFVGGPYKIMVLEPKSAKTLVMHSTETVHRVILVMAWSIARMADKP